MTDFKLSLNKIIFFLFYTFIILYPIGPFISDLIISLLGLSILVCLNNKKIILKILNEKFIIILLIFFISINISAYLSDYLLISMSRSSTFLRWILFLIFTYIYVEKFNINKINYALVFITLFCVADSLFQYYFTYDLFGYQTISSSPAVKNDYNLLTGPFGDEPIVASFIIKLFFPTIYFFLLTTNYVINKNKYIILFIIISLSIFVILVSGQRVSIVYLSFGFFLFFLINYKIIYKVFTNYNLKKYFFITFISIFCLLAIFFNKVSNDTQYSTRVIDGFKNEFSNYLSGNSHYYKLHKISYILMKEDFLLGSGLKSFRYKCINLKNNELNFDLKSICSTHPHNYYIEILTETGIIGFFLILSFLMIIIIKFIKYKKMNSKPSHADGFFISFCICIFPFVPTGSFFSNYNSSLFWFILALLIINISKNKYV